MVLRDLVGLEMDLVVVMAMDLEETGEGGGGGC